MRLLALDTATEACSAALLVGDCTISRWELLGRGHAERLLPMVDELLAEAGLPLASLDGLAVGRGPGAFTGVRIAIGVAQGLALGADLPVVPVSTLAVLARRALDVSRAERGPPAVPAERALVCLDARMGEVYWALGSDRGDGGVRLEGEHLGPPDAVLLPPGGPTIGAGHGFSAYPALGVRLGDALADCRPELLPHAVDLARLGRLELAAGRGVDAADLQPVYLRDEVATRSGRTPGPGSR